jgi:hyperosmotically inducible protein
MKAGRSALLSAVSLTAVLALPCFAQSNSYENSRTATASSSGNKPVFGPTETASSTADTSANDSTNSWRQSINNAARNTEAAGEKAYSEVASDVKNFSLAAKVKAVLHENKSTRDAEVHVAANDGIVTITGSVPSAYSAQQVQEVVANVYGVKAVNNHLDYPQSGRFAASRETDSADAASTMHKNDTPSDTAGGH